MLYKEFLAPRNYEKGQNKLPSQPEINHGNNYDWFHKGYAEFSINREQRNKNRLIRLGGTRGKYQLNSSCYFWTYLAE